MYQPKVKQTQKYSDSQGEHIVCEGKLILLDQLNLPVYPSKGDLAKVPKTGKLYICNGSFLSGQKMYSIIISETEEIGLGDKIHYIGDRSVKNARKILALPEHFSDKHLQAIVDGKMKDGDEVLVKCVWRGKCEECQKAGMRNCAHFDTCGNVIDFTQIHLDQQNQITLFPVQQSLEEVAEEFVSKVSAFEGKDAEHFNPLLKRAFKEGAEWAVKNNYKGKQ